MQKLIMNIMDTINDHTARASVAEREVKLVGDSVGIVGFRCQAIASQLRRCLAASNSDLAKALPAIEEDSYKYPSHAKTLCRFHGDAKELVGQTEQGVTQLNFNFFRARVRDHANGYRMGSSRQLITAVPPRDVTKWLRWPRKPLRRNRKDDITKRQMDLRLS